MTRRIKTTSPKARSIRSTSTKARRVDAAMVAGALGTERVPAAVTYGPSAALDALRRSLLTAVKSTGGRPGFEGADRRQKIPMSDADWDALQRLATALATESTTPTPGQVAAQLLHDAIQSACDRRAPTASSALLTVAEPPSAGYARGRGDAAMSEARKARRAHLELCAGSVGRTAA